jgi:peptide-methionine (S)-S-oxide reductase
MESRNDIAVFGGGCFWCTEAVFQELKGVSSVMSGYAGGTVQHPTYNQVSMGKTGHAEVIRVEFDPAEISYNDLLTVFFATHDPTTMNRQGNDTGPQYRSIILSTNESQQQEAEKYVRELKSDGLAVVTEIKPLGTFYPAEEHHRNYYKNNSDAPYCQIIIEPKLKKVQEKFYALLNDKKTSM